MKRALKVVLIVLTCVVALVVVVGVGGWIWVSSQLKSHDISPAAYSWEKGISDAEVDELARTLVAEMSLKEKVAQMSGPDMARWITSFVVNGYPLPIYQGGNEKRQIPPLAFTDGPRGIAVGRSTCFPVALARAASWDVELERRVGDVFGKEARAWGANYFGGLCVNIVRHPSMGRAQETFGEDPWLTGEMAVAQLEAVQRHNVMACAKHFALNSMETARYVVDVEVDERGLREVYLPQFRRCVEHGVASIMSAYNRFRGQYCGHSHELLTEILRDDWGFTGFVSSDWYQGLRDGLQGVRAGLDVEMPWTKYYGDNLLDLVAQGEVSEDEIDQIARRIIRTKLRFVTRDDPMTYTQNLAASAEHTTLAREVAEQSMVLLKNEDGFLPLDENEISSVAVIGHLANADNTGDRGSSLVFPPYVVTPLQGINSYLRNKATVLYSDGADLDEVERLAAQVDVVVLVAGIREDEEGEYITNDGTKPAGPEEKGPVDMGKFGWEYIMSGGDRYPLSLKQRDLDVISAVTRVNRRCVLTLIGGSAITLEEVKNDVPAILMAFYPGMEGGNALARVLFGIIAPSGKLPLTIPVDESQLPPFDEFADAVEYGPYHGYTWCDKQGYEPAYPFGFGLSYTTFAYDNLQLDSDAITPDGQVAVSVDITNTGLVAGAEVVELYVGFDGSSVERPVKLLRGFAKVMLEPGQRRTVTLGLQARDLAWYDSEVEAWEVEPTTYSVLVGPSSRQQDLLRARFTVSTDAG